MISSQFAAANPETQVLDESSVHLWRLVLRDQEPSDVQEVLDPSEWRRLSRFLDPVMRARRLDCRYRLRCLLSHYLGLPPADIRLRTGPHGRPHLQESAHATDLNFNVSHAADLAMIAVARCPLLGVDIERIHAIQRQGLLRRCFSTDERKRLQGRSEADQQRLFFRGWTAKEAVLKAEGTGVFHNAAGIEFSLGDPIRLLRLRGDPVADQHWFFHEFVAAPLVTGMLALAAGPWQVHQFELEPEAALASQSPAPV
ncbi:MAG: 4'-phosphopantetheinyl transferase superfamily protein [Xanthomonadales bacterium]|nr:4'-phosphopantetheinyl transferase superfamily protein [Xanthomonadales bacterium]